MVRVKRLFISGIIIIITVFFIWFIALDFTRFLSHSYIYDIYPSAILKRIDVLLTAVIAWSVGKDGLNLSDSRRMRTALLFVCFGEVLFLAGRYLLGVVMFTICQSILIIRNSTGLLGKLAHAGKAQKKSLILAGFFILSIFIAFTIIFVKLTRLSDSNAIIYTYGTVLSLSLFSGFYCSILSLLPTQNSRMAVFGSVCFFCCDILVGLDVLLHAGPLWLLANSLIWIFYIPALVLLALSSYRWD